MKSLMRRLVWGAAALAASAPCSEGSGFGWTSITAYWPITGQNNPVNRDLLNSPFGPRNYTPDGYDFHAGIDIDAACNTPVHTFADGYVVFKGNDAASGYYVRMRHIDPGDQTEFFTLYLHLTNDTAYQTLPVDPNTLVLGGTHFVNSGNTGGVGCHLHFGGLVGGTSSRFNGINPMRDDSLPYFNFFPIAINFTDLHKSSFTFEVEIGYDELDLNQIELEVLNDNGTLFDWVTINYDTRQGVDAAANTGENGDEDGLVQGVTRLGHAIQYIIRPDVFYPYIDQTTSFRFTFPPQWLTKNRARVIVTDTQGLQNSRETSPVTGVNDSATITGPSVVNENQSATFTGTFVDEDATGTTAVGPWSWQLGAYRSNGSFVVLRTGTTYAAQQPNLTWVTHWSAAVPALASLGQDWLVQNGQVPGLVTTAVTDSDLTPHSDEHAISINAQLGGTCVAPPGDLVAWYPLDDGAGTAVQDVVGANNGTRFGGPATVAGKVGSALSFDGVDDYVQAPDNEALDVGLQDFSVAFWIRTTQSSGVVVIQDKRLSTSPYTGWHVHLYNGKLALQLADTAGYTTWNSTAYVADGAWHFVALTVDRDGLGMVYRDGSQAYSFNAAARPGSLANNVPLRFGRRSFGSAGSFQGTLDEFDLFQRVLTSGEVLSLYNAGSAGQCRCVRPPSSAVAWYTFDETGGTVAADRIGGNNAAHKNGPTPVSGGASGYALRFDGVDDYVEAPDAAALDFGYEDFSVAFWITTTQSSGVAVIQDKRVSTFPYTGWHVHLYNGNIALQLADTAGYTTWNSTAYVADGARHFVALTVDRNGLAKVYKDGAPAYSFSPAARQGALDNNVPLRIARRSFGSAGSLSATLDEFEVFNRALTENQVKGLYNLGQCKN